MCDMCLTYSLFQKVPGDNIVHQVIKHTFILLKETLLCAASQVMVGSTDHHLCHAIRRVELLEDRSIKL